jgi:hypothetical protein
MRLARDERAKHPKTCDDPGVNSKRLLVRTGSIATKMGCPGHVRFTPVSDRTADIAGPHYGDQGKVEDQQLFHCCGWLARAFQIARSCAGRRVAAHAEFADVDTLAHLLRVIVFVLLRHTGPLLIGIFRFI